MTPLRALGSALAGLVVEDGRLTLMVLCWLALTGPAFSGWSVEPAWRGPILAAGVAAALLAAVLAVRRRPTGRACENRPPGR
jgi:hypothetical protein